MGFIRGFERRRPARSPCRLRAFPRLEALEDRALPSLASPTLITTPGGSVLLGSGAKLTDSATLSGGNNPTGTITFTLYAPGDTTVVDTETATVNGNGSYSTPTGFLPSAVGTYAWDASYSGDANNNPVSSVPPEPTGFTVFNTGVDSSGSPLPYGSVDPHYQLVDSQDPANPGPNSYVVLNEPPVGSPWIADSSTSEWIAPAAGQGSYNFAGFFIYQTTFDLSGFVPSTAQLTGQFAADNELDDVLINSQITGIQGYDQFQSFTPFTISTGFQPGVNTLVFATHDDGGATGFRVEMTGTANYLGAEAEQVTANTTTAITASDNSPAFGETVIYTATISGVPSSAGARLVARSRFNLTAGRG